MLRGRGLFLHREAAAVTPKVSRGVARPFPIHNVKQRKRFTSPRWGQVFLIIARSDSDEANQGPLALNAGLLRCARNDELHRSRDALASEFLSKRYESSPRMHVGPRCLLPLNKGSGAPNGAPGDCQAQSWGCTRYQVQPRPLLQGRSPFGAPLRFDGSCLPPRPGPALPGNTGSTAKRASPMPVQQAPCSPITCRTGMMPKLSADKGD